MESYVVRVCRFLSITFPLWVWALIVNLQDLATTFVALEILNYYPNGCTAMAFYEANPAVAQMMVLLGPWIFYPLSTFVVSLGMAWIGSKLRHSFSTQPHLTFWQIRKEVVLILWLIFTLIIHGTAVVNNLWQMSLAWSCS